MPWIFQWLLSLAGHSLHYLIKIHDEDTICIRYSVMVKKSICMTKECIQKDHTLLKHAAAPRAD